VPLIAPRKTPLSVSAAAGIHVEPLGPMIQQTGKGDAIMGAPTGRSRSEWQFNARKRAAIHNGPRSTLV